MLTAFINVSFFRPASVTHVNSLTLFTNLMHPHLRSHGAANGKKMQKLVKILQKLWAEHAANVEKSEGRLDDARALCDVFIFEEVAAGVEQGFVIPKAGGEGEWIKKNWSVFVRRRDEGDEAMERMVETVEWDEK